MPVEVDNIIKRVMASPSVPNKSVAIAILKKKGIIKQDGSHLVMAKKKER